VQGVNISDFEPFSLPFARKRLKGKVDAAQGNYSYSVGRGTFSGYAQKTTVTVAANVPVGRSFRATQGFGENATVLSSWEEDADSLQTHAEGADPKTLQQLYGDCQTKILRRDLATNRLSLSFNKDGILEFCSTFAVGCAGDCSDGIALQAVKFGP
jgi:hypothetical protein